MRVAYICSNNFSLNERTTKGTDIFNYTLLHGMSRLSHASKSDITVFASGDADVPQPVVSVDDQPSSAYPQIHEWNKHIIFELSLLGKAFSMQDQFDLFHINIGNGDIALPFASFVKKPIVITLHYLIDEDFTRKHFNLYKDDNNVHFVSISEAQRKIAPELNYIATIPHGTDVDTHFQFDPTGGESLIWAGRIAPEKGVIDLIEVAKSNDLHIHLFGIHKPEYETYFDELQSLLHQPKTEENISLMMGRSRLELIPYLQNSKAFLFPVHADEAFGLVLIEAMACGTPVIAYSRGSVPEIILDGETGYLVDPQEGVAGMIKAIKHLYALSDSDYKAMRQRCRNHVVESFSTERMSRAYLDLYKSFESR